MPCWRQNINYSCQILQAKDFFFEIVKYILDENRLPEAAQKK